VSGTQVLDGNGNPLRLRGVDRAGPEYACEQGWGIFDGPNQTNDDAQAPLIKAWGANTVFIGLNEDCWLGINGVKSEYGGANYQAVIKHWVQTIEANGMYPVIAFFWGAAGTQLATDQPTMPDNDHTPLFWQQVATAFKDDPNVILRLQEEPHPNGNDSNAATWQCWSKGDVQYDTSNTLVPISRTTNCNEGFSVVGMQSLTNIVRGTGARNVIQVPGVQYANMLGCTPTQSPATCGFLAPNVRVIDPLSPAQLMADVDVYPDYNQCNSTACYDATYGVVAAQLPLVAGETGPSGPTTKVETFLNWMDAHQQHYYGWAWDTWAGLISDYNGTAASPWGTLFKSHLQSGGT
jgi:endoglucanase